MSGEDLRLVQGKDAVAPLPPLLVEESYVPSRLAWFVNIRRVTYRLHGVDHARHVVRGGRGALRGGRGALRGAARAHGPHGRTHQRHARTAAQPRVQQPRPRCTLYNTITLNIRNTSASMRYNDSRVNSTGSTNVSER